MEKVAARFLASGQPFSALNLNKIINFFIDLALKKEAGLDPLIIENKIEFIFGQKQPHSLLLGKTDWEELNLFLKKIQKECLELIRP